MTHLSIYNPQVALEARRFGITELQAWRKLNAREELRKRRIRAYVGGDFHHD
jgi:hypothetical protein